MQTVLALTVGGSWQPLITAIVTYQPDYVLFIATGGPHGSGQLVNGEGQPCISRRNDEENKPNIVTQTNLPENQYEIVEIEEPDDLNHCFTTIITALDLHEKNNIAWQKIADYTGGTKSMSAALAIAGLHKNWKLSVVSGPRTNLVKVEDGTQIAFLSNAWEINCMQQMKFSSDLFNQYEFSSAAKVLKTLPIQYPVSNELREKINKWLNLAKAFEAWDAFNHQTAMDLLSPYQSDIVPNWIFIKRIQGQIGGHGFEPVEDLLLNAERCIARKQFDNAAARLYRALEMFAQIRLGQLENPIDSSNVDINLIPSDLKATYISFKDERGRIKIGLSMNYELLNGLGDPLGKLYYKKHKEFMSVLSTRNHSILAHGNVPVSKIDAEVMLELISDFLQNYFELMNIQKAGVQFPELNSDEIEQR